MNWEASAILILFFGFIVGLDLTLVDMIKTWEKLYWTQKCYKIIIAVGIASACVRLVIMWWNL